MDFYFARSRSKNTESLLDYSLMEWTSDTAYQGMTVKNCFDKKKEEITSRQRYYYELMDQYKCSGMCKTSMFYYNKPITDGIPNKVCL